MNERLASPAPGELRMTRMPADSPEAITFGETRRIEFADDVRESTDDVIVIIREHDGLRVRILTDLPVRALILDAVDTLLEVFTRAQ